MVIILLEYIKIICILCHHNLYKVHISIIYMKNKEEAKKRLEELGIEEVIISEVKKFGTSAHVVIPRKHIGKKTTIFINKK